jgi:MoxR-like ATPase
MQQTEARVRRMIEELSAGLYEREDAVALCLLAALSGKSAFLYGPPGTAKSMIARRISSAFSGANEFEYLMHRFSTPEDVFGPVSISGLKQDRYVRMTEGYLPSADIAFLDEIWKAGPAILNTLLTVINERTFRNGTENVRVPLKTVIAASNEIPTDRSGLAALYDRFIVRVRVEPLASEEDFAAMLGDEDTKVTVSEPFSKEEWETAITESRKVPIGKEAMSVILEIRRRLGRIYVSDRRWKQSADLLRTAAWVCGKDEVTPAEVPILAYCLWSEDSERETVSEIVRECAAESGGFPLARFSDWKRRYGEAEKRAELSVLGPAKEHAEYEALPVFGGAKCVPVDAGGITFYLPHSKIRPGNSIRGETDDPEVSELFYVTDMRDGVAAVVGGKKLGNTLREVRIPKDVPRPDASAIESSSEELAHLREEISSILSEAEKAAPPGKSSPFVPASLSESMRGEVAASLGEIREAQAAAAKLSERVDALRRLRAPRAHRDPQRPGVPGDPREVPRAAQGDGRRHPREDRCLAQGHEVLPRRRGVR